MLEFELTEDYIELIKLLKVLQIAQDCRKRGNGKNIGGKWRSGS